MNKINLKRFCCMMCLIMVCIFNCYYSSVKANGCKLFDYRGFGKDGIHKVTKTEFDQYGYDINYFNKEGYTFTGFNKDFIHKTTKTKYSPDGYDVNGCDRKGIEYYSRVCCVFGGYDIKGFNIYNRHKVTGTRYNPQGYDRYGFDRNRIHKDTGTKLSPQNFDYRGFLHDSSYEYFNVFTQSYYDKDGLSFWGKDGNGNTPGFLHWLFSKSWYN